ncbi:hypothetical protein [Rubrivivax albus]|uniref:Uncharacterized protein n=1 Tax=Rubrivivax albus TaxID=2499835 RepID=A0A3S2THM9_9BURK|nr:hypothetical protein [Rubrivivax albus]RVT47062.1 hypothetical protein ENE75_24400 [Rubrivivax albus]
MKQAEAARTEVAAKAQLSECARLPLHTEEQCKILTAEWAEHLRRSRGIEWDWGKLPSKIDCKQRYSGTFSPSAWVTPEYCQEHAARIEEGAIETDPVSGRSKKLIAVGAKVEGIIGLSDRMAIELLQKTYYRDKTPQELAIAVHIDSPPDVLQVRQACSSLAPR